MKRVLASIFALTLIVLGVPIASAASVAVTVSEPTHREIDGAFIDDELTALLSYGGRLGQLVFNPPRGNRTWFIDAQLIEEVTAMTSDYVLLGGKKGVGGDVAKNWLNQLNAITRSDQISALPFGSPPAYWISKLAPDKSTFYLSYGAKRLTALLKRQVNQMPDYPNTTYSKLDNSTISAFKEAQKLLTLNANYMTQDQIEKFQGQSAVVLHPELPAITRTSLTLDLLSTSYTLSEKIRLAPGRFTVTTTKQNLPITLVNDFPNPAKISLKVETLNGKVLVGSVPDQVVGGKSKIQVMIPVEVVTSGKSTLVIRIYSEKNKQLGNQMFYPITLKVISPIATWITTGAAIVLFVSALIQSFRRIRKKRGRATDE
jgi:hypothetical protein